MKNINTKKRIFEYCFILLVSCSFCTHLFYDKLYISAHDLTFHLNRIVGLADAFSENQFLPKIYPYSNNGFGYASPLFYCDLFIYPFAYIYKAGLSLITTYKLMIFSFTFFTALISFYTTSKVFNRKMTPYLATILYIFSNYRFCIVFTRAAIGEVQAFMFIPLVIYSIYNVLIKRKDTPIMLGVSFTCLVFSHLISALLFGTVFAILIAIFIVKNRNNCEQIKNTVKTITKGTVIACFLSCWYLLPMFEQIHSQVFYLNYISETFNVLETKLSIRSIFNVFCYLDINGKTINDVVSAGILLIFIPFMYFFVEKKQEISGIICILLFAFLIIIGIIPLPSFLSNIQFLFRLYLLICPLQVVVSSYVLDRINKKILKNLVFIMVIYTFCNIYVINNDLNNSTNIVSNRAGISEIYKRVEDGLDYDRKQLGGWRVSSGMQQRGLSK